MRRACRPMQLLSLANHYVLHDSTIPFVSNPIDRMFVGGSRRDNPPERQFELLTTPVVRGGVNCTLSGNYGMKATPDTRSNGLLGRDSVCHGR